MTDCGQECYKFFETSFYLYSTFDENKGRMMFRNIRNTYLTATTNTKNRRKTLFSYKSFKVTLSR